MNSQDINDLITNQEALVLVEAEELRALCRQYPYVQTFYFMLVKKLYQVQSPKFEEALNMAATYAIDRRFLYDYLNELFATSINYKELSVKVEAKSDIELEIVNRGLEEDNYYDEFVEDLGPEEMEEIVGDSADSDEETMPRPSIGADIDVRLKDILGRMNAVPTDEHLMEAVSRIRNLRLGVGEEKKLEPITDIPEGERIFYLTEDIEEIRADGLETVDLVNTQLKDYSAEKSSIVFIEDMEEKAFEEEAEEEIIDEEEIRREELKKRIRKKHIERLRQSVEAYFAIEEVDDVQSSKEVNILDDIPDNISFREWLKSLKAQVKAGESSVSEFIDHSLEEDDKLMSEALAELLASQGNKVRAIQMYEQLILKFPEKKRFFAQKIIDLS